MNSWTSRQRKLSRTESVSIAAVMFAVLMMFSTTACAESNDGADDGSKPAATSSSTPDSKSAPRSKPRLVRVGNFDTPVEVKSAPGFPNLMFVVEQSGRVMVIRKGRKLSRPFLDIRGRVRSGGEQGLLSVAFPPDYKRSKRFYVYYTDRTGDIRVDEFRRSSAIRANVRTARPVITVRHRENTNHNGGQLHFLGPHLYFGTGDGGGGGDPDGNSQNRNSLLGKLIRIDPRPAGGRPYSVPASNPFVGGQGRDEIFSTGLRNPFRWSFDLRRKGNPAIAIADVGQEKWEEINYLPLSRAKGGNFGWNHFEGFAAYDGAIDGTLKPVAALPHPRYCSIIGGVVVRDRKLPGLRGRYLFSDLCNSAIRYIPAKFGRAKNTRATGLSVPQITSFGESRSGSVFITSLNGPVYRLAR